MPRIEVDVDALADMGEQLHQIRADFQDLNTTVQDADDFLGDPRVSAAVHEFATNWSDERQQISRVLDRTGKMAIHGAEAYRDTDQNVGGNHGNDHTGDGGNSGNNSGSDGPVDTDGDGTPDFRDQDSDDDGISDSIEKDGNPQADMSADAVSAFGSDSTGSTDTSSADTGSYGGGYDTGSYDTGGTSTGSSYDSGSYDTGSYDTGSYDTGTADTGTADTGTADTGSGTGAANDSGGSTGADSGAAAADQEPISGEGTLSDGGTVGLTAETTVPAESEDSEGGLSASAMALAPVGLLGAAGAAAWAAGRKADDEKQPEDQDDEV